MKKGITFLSGSLRTSVSLVTGTDVTTASFVAVFLPVSDALQKLTLNLSAFGSLYGTAAGTVPLALPPSFAAIITSPGEFSGIMAAAPAVTISAFSNGYVWPFAGAPTLSITGAYANGTLDAKFAAFPRLILNNAGGQGFRMHREIYIQSVNEAQYLIFAALPGIVGNDGTTANTYFSQIEFSGTLQET